eukprot:5544634-Prorocentrum_lima.AAC.1
MLAHVVPGQTCWHCYLGFRAVHRVRHLRPAAASVLRVESSGLRISYGRRLLADSELILSFLLVDGGPIWVELRQQRLPAPPLTPPAPVPHEQAPLADSDAE